MLLALKASRLSADMFQKIKSHSTWSSALAPPPKTSDEVQRGVAAVSFTVWTIFQTAKKRVALLQAPYLLIPVSAVVDQAPPRAIYLSNSLSTRRMRSLLLLSGRDVNLLRPWRVPPSRALSRTITLWRAKSERVNTW